MFILFNYNVKSVHTDRLIRYSLKYLLYRYLHKINILKCLNKSVLQFQYLELIIIVYKINSMDPPGYVLFLQFTVK